MSHRAREIQNITKGRERKNGTKWEEMSFEANCNLNDGKRVQKLNTLSELIRNDFGEWITLCEDIGKRRNEKCFKFLLLVCIVATKLLLLSPSVSSLKCRIRLRLEMREERENGWWWVHDSFCHVSFVPSPFPSSLFGKVPPLSLSFFLSSFSLCLNLRTTFVPTGSMRKGADEGMMKETTGGREGEDRTAK